MEMEAWDLEWAEEHLKENEMKDMVDNYEKPENPNAEDEAYESDRQWRVDNPEKYAELDALLRMHTLQALELVLKSGEKK